MTAADRPLVVVLGASGFIGSAVTRELAKRPVRLRTVARRPPLLPSAPVADVESRSADLTVKDRLAEAVRDADAVVHLVAALSGGKSWRGADDDPESERVNVGLVRDLVDVLADGTAGSTAGPPAVLFAGTTAQAGATERIRIDGTEPDLPETAYDRQKLRAEEVVKKATAEGAVRGISLRLPTVFGHGADSTAADRGVVSAMARRALEGRPLTMWNDGSVLRDLLYVDDVVRAFAAALDNVEPLAGRHWLLGTGAARRLGDVFALIAEVVSEHTGLPPVPVTVVEPPAGAARSTDFHSVEVDSSAFRRVTGWRPEVPLREALTRTVAALASSSVPTR
ncbi:SDR family epimerase/dehydratase [Nonomuraea terrae]|uniref:SDR family epimerase/dehydratase n=1 Tax=Nonomuraea terrae TaxID=2530383 RepID=A0A4R4Z8B0_9ACTN|nr:NAD-dependent epimerase/dehydratase [Nonomuraea terrae]TDD54186.1 SDR family epimerase/dehydratase [Nonomuraea terrae]